MAAEVSSNSNVIKNFKNTSTKKKSNEVKKNNEIKNDNKLEETIVISKHNDAFYLEKEVKNLAENCKKKQNSINSQRDKDIEKTKLKMEKQFKEEQERYRIASEKIKIKNQRKEEKIRLKAQRKEAMLLRAEFLAREELCKKEIFESITKIAEQKGWFETALEMYKAMPELFKKD